MITQNKKIVIITGISALLLLFAITLFWTLYTSTDSPIINEKKGITTTVYLRSAEYEKDSEDPFVLAIVRIDNKQYYKAMEITETNDLEPFYIRSSVTTINMTETGTIAYAEIHKDNNYDIISIDLFVPQNTMQKEIFGDVQSEEINPSQIINPAYNSLLVLS